ncbi:MAG: hypothetical protein IJ809_01545 [Clostridia bacterium]|nr:hypothetical protein [Clostridia bacterium]
MRKLTVNISNETVLSKYIINYFKNLSYSSFMKALRNKDIKVNSKRVSSDVTVKKRGCYLCIYIR